MTLTTSLVLLCGLVTLVLLPGIIFVVLDLEEVAMTTTTSRVLLIVGVVFILPGIVLAGLIAGPVIALAWVLEDVRATLRTL